MQLGLILGDQLSRALPTLAELDRHQDVLVMAEVAEEATYVGHHKQKIAFLFSAMRHFAAELRDAGWQVHYYAWGEHHCDDLEAVLADALGRTGAEAVVVTQCGEYRLQQRIDQQWSSRLACPVHCLEDSRFLGRLEDFARWASGKKQLRMEFFYRQMRRRTGLLMDGDQPVGGQWNFDASNRKAYKGEVPLPPPLTFQHDDLDAQVLALVERAFADHIGSLTAFHWGTTRSQALAALAHFIEHRLPWFGDYQDAMVTGEDGLFHSLLSPYLNAGLLDPWEVCRAAEQAWYDGAAPLNAVEGFIRQILGWREYVRGIYWLLMPDYAAENRLGNQRALPGYYWSGDTGMHCMRESLRNTLEHAYAHHIQRLMVTGNFALLLGVLPEAICRWYLEVYADAYEWVELPNTLGMVMHADGGYLGSKPYAASGSYIQRMSDYCKHCRYNVKTASEEDSCPFNSLYWHFIHRHRRQFAGNHRMRMIYRNLDRMDPARVEAILARAESLLADPEVL
ncbi:deoxyribodipyrimidine photolyase-like protein [Alcanivorax hongdengensis A-11-3]|uniref:Deoxyribodipyrimidine photolyase-like protein n=1 Tax=Alcanivorax hongdengensis A-11-3 TaxID=1177179 RepID=L0WEZ7_9GAMM|nr:cryptochrome/photolyase family protein [Alcanivorax hongdengensis]EKF75393.1 deoxyribodipyrimidine photolyase-like protein [Alcanivorax hongdengensis A-11-3]